MKRAIISMCCALAIFLHVSAQIKYGVKGGVNLTNVVNSFDRSVVWIRIVSTTV